MTTAEMEVDQAPEPEIKVIKTFAIVGKDNVRYSKLGPHVVDARIRRQLFQELSEVLPPGPCLFDWKVEHHEVDDFDVAAKRWAGALEGDVVVQGYLRYQIPEVRDET